VKNFRQFVRFETVEEALSLKRAVGEKGLYIAGGTGVVPFAGQAVEVLIDLTHLGLHGITVEEGVVRIGATTRLADLLTTDTKAAVPALYDAVRGCATPLIRNVATLGGSLAGIFLPSDPAVALLALGADVELLGDEQRTVPIESLLSTGWLGGDEIIRSVSVRKPGEGEGTCFTKFGRSDIDIALVNAAALIRMDGAGMVEGLRVAVGQTSSLPVFLGETADLAKDRKLSTGLIGRLATHVSDKVKPRSDYRASGQYRKHLIRTMVERCIYGAAKEAGWSLED
jgi:CO/xanthine dehydrogenase FAD-binding subunit